MTTDTNPDSTDSEHQLITDGGHPADRTERWLAMGRPEPVAAERVDGGDCSYDDCDAEADYRVKFVQQDGDDVATTLMCEDCSRSNAIHVQGNELLDQPMDAGDEEIVTDGGVRAPEILDVVPAPDGLECQLYGRGEEPVRCDEDADYLFVFDALLGEETSRRNALACDGCFTPPEQFQPEPVTDGGQIREFVADGERPAVSYGPSHPSQPGEWVLAVTTEDGRVEINLDEEAMYDLWTEVRGVPWPHPDDRTEQDRLVRQVLHFANGADEEMLHDAIEALGGRHE
ncbi:hypothetical protein [Halomicrobium salinisoli]|uniref:hypothetical protein n=1 Tax=Halomicrobium salinisoli TaxID=2878391 RepID=UPI001CEFC34B|nr:hypothetical protein [Halomicrobium salinisoli]